MNELQLLRAQLATERAHIGAAARAMAAADAAPRQPACLEYLACVLTFFAERDTRLATLLRAGTLGQPPAHGPLAGALERGGTSGEALACLGAVRASTGTAAAADAVGRLALFIAGPWGERRDALDALLAANTRIAEWRAFAGIDADSILQERHLFAPLDAASSVPAWVAISARRGGQW